MKGVAAPEREGLKRETVSGSGKRRERERVAGLQRAIDSGTHPIHIILLH
jgi:hypothetical protein